MQTINPINVFSPKNITSKYVWPIVIDRKVEDVSKSQPVEVAYCRFLKDFDLNFNVMKIVWAALGRRMSCCNFVFVFKVIHSTGLRQVIGEKGRSWRLEKRLY